LLFNWLSGVKQASKRKLFQGFMNRLNRKVEYALIALKHMGNKYAGQLTTVKEICSATGIPFDATSRVMQLMAQHGILKSEQGAHGGYLLMRDLTRVSFFDVMTVVSGPVEVVRCASGQSDCEFFASCNVISPMKNFNEKLAEFYKSLSVAELIQGKEIARERAEAL
jgi:Rrf2 family protein